MGNSGVVDAELGIHRLYSEVRFGDNVCLHGHQCNVFSDVPWDKGLD